MPRPISHNNIAHRNKSTSPTIIHNHSETKTSQPGFFSNVSQGFGLGAGQAIAHNIFRQDPIIKHVYESNEPNEYIQCMKEYNDVEECKQYLQTKPR